MVTQKLSEARARMKRPQVTPEKPLWQALKEISDGIPAEAWEGFPTDCAKNFDDLLEPEWIDGKPVVTPE